MNKPAFLWWAHKKVWDILTNNPQTTIEEAAKTVCNKYHVKWPFSACFACQAKIELQREEGTHISCERHCPIEWGKNESCVDTTHGLYIQWNAAWGAGNWGRAATLAARIRDLPLRKNARELYDVKEVPFYGD